MRAVHAARGKEINACFECGEDRKPTKMFAKPEGPEEIVAATMNNELVRAKA